MSRNFILTNKVGHELRDAIENPSFEKSEIVVYASDGIEIERLPVTPLTLYMYDPEADPRYQKPYKIVMPTGEVEIPIQIPEDMVTTEENPFVQIIYRFINRRGEATKEDVMRYILNERCLLPNNKYGISRIESLLDEMNKGSILGGLIIVKGGMYYTGVKLKTGKRLIRIYPGFDPFEYQIMKMFEDSGDVSREEIHRLIMDRLRWAKNARLVEFYINKLIKQGNISRVTENWFTYKKSLESN